MKAEISWVEVGARFSNTPLEMHSRTSYITLYHLHAYYESFSNLVPRAILKIASHLAISLCIQLCVHS